MHDEIESPSPRRRAPGAVVNRLSRGVALTVLALVVPLVVAPGVPAASATSSASSTQATARLQVDVQDAVFKVNGATTLRVTVHADDNDATEVVLDLGSLADGLRATKTRFDLGTVPADRTVAVKVSLKGTTRSPARSTLEVTATASNASAKSARGKVVTLAPGRSPRAGAWKFVQRGASTLRFRVTGNGTRLTGLRGVLNLTCYSTSPPFVSVRPVTISAPAFTIDRSGRVRQTVRSTYRAGGGKTKVKLTLGARFDSARTRIAYIDVVSSTSGSTCFLGGTYLKGKRS